MKREIEKLRAQASRTNLKTSHSQGTITPNKYVESQQGTVVLLKLIETLAKDEFEKTLQTQVIKKNDILLLLDSFNGSASTTKKLADLEIKALVVCVPLNQDTNELLKQYDISVLTYNELKIEWLNGNPYIKKHDIEKALNIFRDSSKLEAEETVQRIIDEYKEQRKQSKEHSLSIDNVG